MRSPRGTQECVLQFLYYNFCITIFVLQFLYYNFCITIFVLQFLYYNFCITILYYSCSLQSCITKLVISDSRPGVCVPLGVHKDFSGCTKCQILLTDFDFGVCHCRNLENCCITLLFSNFKLLK